MRPATLAYVRKNKTRDKVRAGTFPGGTMKIGKLVMSLVAIFLPWVALLIYDNPLGALIALIMQVTLIGWIPASIWAWKTVHGRPEHVERED